MHEFEIGKSDQNTFATQVSEFYDLKMNSDEFVELFRSAAESKFDGVDLLLRELSEKYELACLTNTNPIQWPRIKDELGLAAFFDKQYISYELGLMKPDNRIYEYVLRDTGLNPQEILFVDDNLENIEAARSLEFHCCHVEDFEGMRVRINQILN